MTTTNRVTMTAEDFAAALEHARTEGREGVLHKLRVPLGLPDDHDPVPDAIEALQAVAAEFTPDMLESDQ